MNEVEMKTSEPNPQPAWSERPALLVLVGDITPEPGSILASIVRHTFEDRHKVPVHTRGHVQDLVVAASRRPYDLFVLSLGNIAQRGIDLEPAACIDRAAELVPYLKLTYRKPIVAVAGRYTSAALHWLEQAGADVILPMPFTLEQFADLIGVCLDSQSATPLPPPTPPSEGRAPACPP
jgi:hypothetical protein